MNFLLRLGLESNGMIIFIYPGSRSIPTYNVLKWATMIFLNFPNFFSIFLEFSFMRRLITKRNDTFRFPSFSAFFNLFWLEMKQKNGIFKKNFLFFWNFYYASGRNKTEREFLFSVFLGLFQPILALYVAKTVFFKIFSYVFGIFYYTLGRNETER